MFYENWATLQENFYEGAFMEWTESKSGINMNSTFLIFKHRENLRTLFNDMLGALNSSHLEFYSSGEEQDTYYLLQTAATGIVFDQEKPLKVERIVKKSPMDNTDKIIERGDSLVSVND